MVTPRGTVSPRSKLTTGSALARRALVALADLLNQAGLHEALGLLGRDVLRQRLTVVEVHRGFAAGVGDHQRAGHDVAHHATPVIFLQALGSSTTGTVTRRARSR